MQASTAGWGEGYVTDIAYLPGYYPYQSPLNLHVACLVGGVAGIHLRADTPLSYLELGCGYGFGAMMLAACNPAWRVTGVDFSPAHIAAARQLAEDAGVANVRFIEADLAALADTPQAAEIPLADVVSMHGLWSWVGDSVRRGIVRLLDSKVRPGGIVHISYNSLPGWQGALGMQRLLREAGLRGGAARSDHQAEIGLRTVHDLIDAKAHHLAGNAFVERILEHTKQGQAAYVAHEFMNANWRPCFHADVVEAVAPAKLDWVATAELMENFSPLTFSDEVRAVIARFDDPVMRELIKDMCLPRCLRHDVFVRGAQRLRPAERDAALCEVSLALLVDEAQFVWDFDVPAGRANIERGFFGPIVTALAQASRRIGDLLALPDLPRRDNPGELVGILVGTQQAMPVLGPAAMPGAAVQRVTQAAAKRLVRHDNLNSSMALATAGTGAPISCPMLDLFVAAQLLANPTPDPAGWVGSLGAGQPEAEQQRLREFIERLLTERAPIWRRLGALPAGAPAF